MENDRDLNNAAHDESAPTTWSNRLGLRVNGFVFFGSAAFIFAVVLFGTFFTAQAESLFGRIQDAIVTNFGWVYLLAVSFFLGFVIWLCFTRFGRIRLGPDDSRPAYSFVSWFAMLFSAGMGIGLLFYSVAEPILHYANPPVGAGETIEAARQSMRLTFFHWGFHAWAIYIVVGLSLAYFSFRKGLPLTIRSTLYPILGERIHGRLGDFIDIFAVIGTLFGVATSLGFGVMQVNAGLNYLFDIPLSGTTQLILIALITTAATLSVVSGLDRGIRRLSELNLILALFLLVFVFVAGPSVFLLDALIQNTGNYLSGVVELSFQTYAFQDSSWKGSWTLFYWGWWIAWSPFVGMFIARISRGRTLREFITGVLLVPSILTFIWLTIFGNTALNLALNSTAVDIAQAVELSLPTALFVVLDQFPLASVSSLVATIVVVTFFVTSSDSGSLVIDIITAGGHTNPPVQQRIFWAVTEGLVAAVLLITGGLTALQTAAITTALPLVVILLLMCYGLVRSLRKEIPLPGYPPRMPISKANRRPVNAPADKTAIDS